MTPRMLPETFEYRMRFQAILEWLLPDDLLMMHYRIEQRFQYSKALFLPVLNNRIAAMYRQIDMPPWIEDRHHIRRMFRKKYAVQKKYRILFSMAGSFQHSDW